MMPRSFRSMVIVLSVAALYGLICRLLFAAPTLSDWMQIVSVAFIYIMPMSLGALVCYLGYKLDRPSRFWAFGAPPLTMLILLIGTLVVQLEAAICVAVAAPVVTSLALVGGCIMSVILLKMDRSKLPVTFAVLMPFALSPVEQLWETPHETRTMRNTVVIHASAADVWNQIYAVPAIDAKELPNQWIYLLGFPRPISAEIDKMGVGGRRHATFERDVSFYEVVTLWEPERKLSFTIKADPEFIPHTAFDEHIIVGGRFYDVLDGTYEIEELSKGVCELNLSSTHRLSTRFNWYAGWWSEWVMNQIQGSILEVIRKRCEGFGVGRPVTS
jgi:hypothetical protein